MNSEKNKLGGVVLGSVSNNVDNQIPNVPNNVDTVLSNETQNTATLSQVAPSGENNNAVLQPNDDVLSDDNKVEQQSINQANYVIEPKSVVQPKPILQPETTSQSNVVSQSEVVSQPNTVVQPSSGEVNSNIATIAPEPEYTNIANISPQSASNFDNNIGVNPPISLEEEKKPKKKGNKVVFIFVVLILLAGVAGGTYYVLNYTSLLSKNNNIIISTKDLSINLGSTLSNDINDYATITGTSSNNCTLDMSKVDVSKEGNYKYSVSCSNITKEGNVTIVDARELVINTKKLYKTKDEQVTALEFVVNPRDDVNYEFVNEEDVNNALTGGLGTYDIKIKGTTNSGKSAEGLASLTLIEYKIKGYTSCSLEKEAITNASVNEEFKFAIIDDGNNSFGNVVYKSYIFKFNSVDEYNKEYEEYMKKNELTINEVTGEVAFNKDDLSITIKNEVNSADVQEEYGSDNLKNFATIRNYFQNTLNYKCNYEKSE